jgi:hypothetical protein
MGLILAQKKRTKWKNTPAMHHPQGEEWADGTTRNALHSFMSNRGEIEASDCFKKEK